MSFSVNAEAAILMNANTGQILYEKNIHTPHYPASITKIGTVIYALKKKGDQLDKVLTGDSEAIASISEDAIRRSNYTLPSYWIEQGSTHMGIKKGEELSFKDLLYGMMVCSANDAANMIAQFVGDGSIPKFMEELNDYLKSIGCRNTHFVNPHGLHHPNHQATAYDMAILTKEGLKNDAFREIVKTVRYTRPKTNKQPSTTLLQGNRLLRKGPNYYAKAIGVKTGYTSHAQSTFVAAATHEDRTLIAVLLKTKDRKDMFNDSIKMFEAAFNQPKVQKVLLKAGPQKFTLDLPGTDENLLSYTKNDLSIEYYPAEEPKVKCLLYWNKLTLPVAKDQIVGELSLQDDKGDILKRVPLYASDEVKQGWLGWFKSFF